MNLLERGSFIMTSGISPGSRVLELMNECSVFINPFLSHSESFNRADTPSSMLIEFGLWRVDDNDFR